MHRDSAAALVSVRGRRDLLFEHPKGGEQGGYGERAGSKTRKGHCGDRMRQPQRRKSAAFSVMSAAQLREPSCSARTLAGRRNRLRLLPRVGAWHIPSVGFLTWYFAQSTGTIGS